MYGRASCKTEAFSIGFCIGIEGACSTSARLGSLTPEALRENVLPQAGASCSTPGASCGRDCELIRRCAGGMWQWIRGSCPICAAPDTPIGDRPIGALVASTLGHERYSSSSMSEKLVPHAGQTAVPKR